jgi:hypothetical protein
MCLSGATGLPVECCFSELVLYKYPTQRGSNRKQISSSYFIYHPCHTIQIFTCIHARVIYLFIQKHDQIIQGIDIIELIFTCYIIPFSNHYSECCWKSSQQLFSYIHGVKKKTFNEIWWWYLFSVRPTQILLVRTLKVFEGKKHNNLDLSTTLFIYC